MITGINESKTLTNIYHANVNVDLMKENVIQIHGGIMINVNLSGKNVMYVKKMLKKWKMLKYLASIMDNLRITCDEIIESYDKETKANFNEESAACKTQNFYILLAFLLITIAFLIAVSIYCYMIKYRAKQKHLLPFHYTKLKQVYLNNVN